MAALKEILVADDEAGIRALLFDVLSKEGFRVTLAKDGKETLDQMKKRRFDLIITDIDMPRLDGIDLLKKMKEKGRREKVIIMSGMGPERIITAENIVPIYKMLEKPFPMNRFLEIVTAALADSGRKSKGSGILKRRKKGAYHAL